MRCGAKTQHIGRAYVDRVTLASRFWRLVARHTLVTRKRPRQRGIRSSPSIAFTRSLTRRSGFSPLLTSPLLWRRPISWFVVNHRTG